MLSRQSTSIKLLNVLLTEIIQCVSYEVPVNDTAEFSVGTKKFRLKKFRYDHKLMKEESMCIETWIVRVN